jgi:hypothetical protein
MTIALGPLLGGFILCGIIFLSSNLMHPRHIELPSIGGCFAFIMISYLGGFIPALFSSLYPAACIREHRPLSLPLYFLFSAGSALLFGMLLSLLLHGNPLILGGELGVISLIAATMSYPIFVKRMVRQALVTSTESVGT